MPPMSRQKLHADTTWFHVFRAFVFGGDCARLGAYATTILLVVKAHTNFDTGFAFPSIETIVKSTGISKRQIINSLKTLEEAGYLIKSKRGRKNHYRIRERIQVLDSTHRPTAVASWDYLPMAVQDTCAQLKSFLLTGKIPEGSTAPSLVYIEQLNLNFQVVNDGTGIQNNGASK